MKAILQLLACCDQSTGFAKLINFITVQKRPTVTARKVLLIPPQACVLPKPSFYEKNEKRHVNDPIEDADK
jgi:hypothetical protein